MSGEILKMNVGLNGAPYYVEWTQKTRNLVEVGSV